MTTITITSDKVPSNVGRTQQFEDKEHLNGWLADRDKDHIPGATVKTKKLYMTVPDPDDATKTILEAVGTVSED